MLNNRHFIAYSITTLFYLALAGIIVYLPTPTKIATESSKEKVIQISVTEFVPQPPVEEVEPREEEKPPEEVEKEEVKVPVPEKPKPQVIKKEIEKKAENKKIKKQKRKKEKTKKKTSKKSVKKKAKRQSSSKKRKVNPAKVNLFYKQIRLKINRYKAYPKIAKRRRMQGRVNVKFTILPSGRVSNIRLSGPKIFHKSARRAVEKAFPVNVKNIPISLPSTVRVSLDYTIH